MPEAARRTASTSAAAHVADNFTFLAFAACIAVVPACLRRRRALRRVLRDFLAPLVAARSMRVSAFLNFRITLPGIDSSTHAGFVSAAPKIQRGVVQGSVVLDDEGVVVDVVGDVFGDIVVVVVLWVGVPGTVASRRISPPSSAT